MLPRLKLNSKENERTRKPSFVIHNLLSHGSASLAGAAPAVLVQISANHNGRVIVNELGQHMWKLLELILNG